MPGFAGSASPRRGRASCAVRTQAEPGNEAPRLCRVFVAQNASQSTQGGAPRLYRFALPWAAMLAPFSPER